MRPCDMRNGAEVIDVWREGVKRRVGDHIIRHTIADHMMNDFHFNVTKSRDE